VRNIECVHFFAEAYFWLQNGPNRAVSLTMTSPERGKPDLVQVDVVAPVAGRDYSGTAVGENYLTTFDLAVQELYGSAAVGHVNPSESGEIPIHVMSDLLVRNRA
jgi:hypothetical protein